MFTIDIAFLTTCLKYLNIFQYSLLFLQYLTILTDSISIRSLVNYDTFWSCMKKYKSSTKLKKPAKILNKDFLIPLFKSYDSLINHCKCKLFPIFNHKNTIIANHVYINSPKFSNHTR